MQTASRVEIFSPRHATRIARCLVAVLFAALSLHLPDAASAGEEIAIGLISQPKQPQVARAMPDVRPVPALVGNASVIDGDTIEIEGQRVELHGIDAPEIRQTCKVIVFSWTCGEEARKMLSALVAEQQVTCFEKGRDGEDLPVAVCRTNGVHLNETMVRIGMALAYRDRSLDYVADESAAQQEEVGVWRSKFDPPWEWRAREDGPNQKPHRRRLHR